MALWSLNKKSILIIDDFPEMRSLIRGMVTDFGAQHIEQARNGTEAVEALAGHRFDIVLCDYNLGDGKDGQQVLEEAKHRNLLPFTTVFAVITAECSSQMVMGALEYQPDAYISKPVTKTVLQVRLKKLLEKKDSLREINRALDKKLLGRALELCNQQLQNSSKHRFELLKLKSDILIKTGEYDQAKALCETVLEERELPWALFDTGRVHFYRQQYPEAADIFSRIIDANSAFVSAYDWLADTQKKLGDPGSAQRTLMSAVEKSAKSVLRQRALAVLADKNQDYEVTEKARRKAVRVGKGSILRQPSDYAGLAKVLVKLSTAKEALKVLDLIKHEFHDNPQADLEAATVGSEIYTALGNEKLSEEMLDKAVALAADYPGFVSADVGVGLAQACHVHGRKAEANEIICNIVKNNHDNDDVLEKISDLYGDAAEKQEIQALIDKTRNEIIAVNNEGVRLLKIGKTAESIELFSKAAGGLPHNPIINLNAAQALINMMKQSQPTRPSLEEALTYLQAANNSDSHKERQRRLLAVCRELSTQIQAK